MIRVANINDAPRIAEINVASWRFAYKNIVSEEVLYRDFIVADRIEIVKRWLTENKYKIYVYEEETNKIVKGMMGTGKCEDPDKPKSFELHFLYVEPYYSRHGIGSQLIKYYEKEGKNAGYIEFVIWVLEDNEIGRMCYEKNGYHLDGCIKIFEKLNKKEVRYIKEI